MGEIIVRTFEKTDIDTLTEIIYEAWQYYAQEVQMERIRELLKYYLTDETKIFWLAEEEGQTVGFAEARLMESYRCEGEEAHLNLLYIRDSASNYYDVHSKIMEAIFTTLREEEVEFLRVDTALENTDLIYV